jgi:hypothetical protein
MLVAVATGTGQFAMTRVRESSGLELYIVNHSLWSCSISAGTEHSQRQADKHHQAMQQQAFR